jgi:hypothetical protein
VKRAKTGEGDEGVWEKHSVTGRDVGLSVGCKEVGEKETV